MANYEDKDPTCIVDGEPVARNHHEAAVKNSLENTLSAPMKVEEKRDFKLTPSQKESIERVKAAYAYEQHDNIKNLKVEAHEYFASVSADGMTFLDHLHALIGKRGAITYYRDGGMEFKGQSAEYHVKRILRDMASKGLYKYPERKSKPDPVLYGIEFYTVDQPKSGGLHSIGIHRNKTTEKYFKWAFPKENISGTIFDYSYMMHGGDGILKVDTPTGELEWISFRYEPRDVLSVYGFNYEEQIKTRLNNRQIIAKVFKAWLKSRDLL